MRTTIKVSNNIKVLIELPEQIESIEFLALIKQVQPILKMGLDRETIPAPSEYGAGPLTKKVKRGRRANYSNSEAKALVKRYSKTLSKSEREEIAQELGISLGLLQSRVYFIRQKFKKT